MTSDRGGRTRLWIPLRYRDMDTFGHLNQSMYHVFLEEARAALVSSVLPADPVEFVLARVELDHRREVRLTDRRVCAENWVEAIGTRSLTLGGRITLEDGTVAAEAVNVLVAWDHDRREGRPITDDERAALERAPRSAEGVAS